MLILKSIEFSEPYVAITYCVRHNTGALRTTLEQDMTLKVNTATGKVTGQLILADLETDSIENARFKLAEWCDRMAAALRAAVRKEGADLPVYERGEFEVNALPPHLKLLYQEAVTAFATEGEAEMGAVREKLIAEKNPLIYVPNALATAEAEACRALGLPD